MADPHDAEGVLPRFPTKTALALRKSIPQIRPASRSATVSDSGSAYATFSFGSAGCLNNIMNAIATTREYPANMYQGVLQSGVAALYT